MKNPEPKRGRSVCRSHPPGRSRSPQRERERMQEIQSPRGGAASAAAALQDAPEPHIPPRERERGCKESRAQEGAQRQPQPPSRTPQNPSTPPRERERERERETHTHTL